MLCNTLLWSVKMAMDCFLFQENFLSHRRKESEQRKTVLVHFLLETIPVIYVILF